MNKKRYMDASPRKAWNKMPRRWNWERFRIVKAGNGQVALHSRVHNRFVRMNNMGGMDVSPKFSWRKLPRGWKWERFTVARYRCRRVRKKRPRPRPRPRR